MFLLVFKQSISRVISSPSHDYQSLLVNSSSIAQASNLVDFSYMQANSNTLPIHNQVIRIFTMPF